MTSTPVAPSLLIVDDESAILDTLRILLKNEGFEVLTAQGGKAGLEQLKNAAPDIVLTDVRMPQVSGIDILTAVREQDPETPVILMTAQASLQIGHPGGERRRVLLHPEAVFQRRSGRDLPARRRAPAAPGREQAAQAGDPAARAVPVREAAGQVAHLRRTCCAWRSRWRPPRARC